MTTKLHVSITRSGNEIAVVKRPFRHNPFDLYHSYDVNNYRYLTLVAWDYWIAPHIPNRSYNREGDIAKVSRRVRIWLEQLATCRTAELTVIVDSNDKSCVKITQDLPSDSAGTQGTFVYH